MAQSDRRRALRRRAGDDRIKTDRPTSHARVTVLGSSSSIPRPGRACSSYLVEAGDFALALDLGTGAFANLRRTLPFDALNAVVISHMHPDHFLDLVPLRYALRYGKRSNDRRVRVLLPPGGEAILRSMVAAFSSELAGDYLATVFEMETYDPDAVLALGPLSLRFAPTVHYIPTFAMRCSVDGASLTYSADTAPSPAVGALARGSDVFLCEATLGPDGNEDGTRGHLSAREAGELARQAGVRRLALTHYGAGEDESALTAQAAKAFAGEIVVVDDHARWPLGL